VTCVRLFLTLALLVAAPATVLAQLPIGTAVGFPVTSGYDAGGRRDPFVSLVVPKRPTASTPAIERLSGTLRGLSLADAKLTGIIKSGDRYLATVEAPDRRSYSIRADDRLLDAVVKRIDADGVVFMELESSGFSGGGPREVRKTLRPAAEVIR
jgi:Tfp pilus assembly protein PilP